MQIRESSTPPAAPSNNLNKDNLQRNIWMFVALGLLILGLIILYFFKNNPDLLTSITGDKKDGGAWVGVFPVWLAILIPFIVSKKKKGQLSPNNKSPFNTNNVDLTPDKIRLISTMIIGVIVAVFIFVFFMLSSLYK